MTGHNPQRTLLLVDDEENILSALTRLFRRDGYRILRANSGREGLELLAANDVGVILSDQRMPQMTGVEFLTRARVLYPDKVCMVLSGYTDLKSVTDAINKGAAYKFLTKPWDDELLRRNVQEAFEQYELRQENERLNRALKKANEELAALNRDLERRVELNTRELRVNLKRLRVARDVLENMPLAVLGVSEDGVIAVANQLAHQWFARGAEDLVGALASEVLPLALNELCDEQCADICVKADVELGPEHTADVYCRRVGQSTGEQGWILALTPSARPG